MNAKKAKQLRRLVRLHAPAVPPVSKVLSERRDCIVNNPRSLRGTYLAMKRIFGEHS